MEIKKIRVGIWLKLKKLEKSGLLPLITDKFVNYKHFQFEFIHFPEEYRPQSTPDIDILIHKMTDYFSSSEQAVNSVITKPPIIVVDLFESVRKVTRREWMMDILVCATRNMESIGVPLYRMISASTFSNDNNNNNIDIDIEMPVIVKTDCACAKSISHKMIIIQHQLASSSQLMEWFPQQNLLMIQKYINHFPFLVKVYVFNGHVDIQIRQSIQMEHPVQLFDSQTDLPKQHVQSDSPEFNRLLQDRVGDIKQLAVEISRISKLTMFGFDLILSRSELKFYVVDLNYFPGFYGMPEFTALFLEYLEQLIVNRQS